MSQQEYFSSHQACSDGGDKEKVRGQKCTSYVSGQGLTLLRGREPTVSGWGTKAGRETLKWRQMQEELLL